MSIPSPESSPSQRGRVVRFDLSLSTIITMVLVVAGLWVVIRLLPVLLVLVAALIIVGTLNPSVQWLEARRLRRGVSIAIAFAVSSSQRQTARLMATRDLRLKR